MSQIIIKNIKDDIFGNLVYLTNGIVELKASLDFGPRILHFSLSGMENMFYNDTEKSPINDKEYAELGGGIHKTYGGHRLWASPEIMPRCYYPDDKPVSLTKTDTGVILEAPAEQFNNIQKTIEISLNDYNSEVCVINSIKNVGAWDIVFAPWAITVMSQGGIEVVPQADRQTGFLGNRFIGVWPYTKMSDKRVIWGDKYIILKQDPENTDAFKIGTNNEKQWAAYFNKNQLFVKQYSHVIDGFYPDFSGCSFETYTNGDFLEIETLGQIGVVAPSMVSSHTEKWQLFKELFMPDCDEQKITETLDKYI